MTTRKKGKVTRNQRTIIFRLHIHVALGRIGGWKVKHIANDRLGLWPRRIRSTTLAMDQQKNESSGRPSHNENGDDSSSDEKQHQHDKVREAN